MRPIYWALLGLFLALADLFCLHGFIAKMIYCTAGLLGLIALIIFFFQSGSKNLDDAEANVLRN